MRTTYHWFPGYQSVLAAKAQQGVKRLDSWFRHPQEQQARHQRTSKVMARWGGWLVFCFSGRGEMAGFLLRASVAPAGVGSDSQTGKAKAGFLVQTSVAPVGISSDGQTGEARAGFLVRASI